MDMLMRIINGFSASMAVPEKVVPGVGLNFVTSTMLQFKIGGQIHQYDMADVMTIRGSGTFIGCYFWTDWFSIKPEGTEPTKFITDFNNQIGELTVEGGTGPSTVKFKIIDKHNKVVSSMEAAMVDVLGVLLGGFQIRMRLKRRHTLYIIHPSRKSLRRK